MKAKDGEVGFMSNFGIAGNVTRRLASLKGLGSVWKAITEGFSGIGLGVFFLSILVDNFTGKGGGDAGLDVAGEGGGKEDRWGGGVN